MSELVLNDSNFEKEVIEASKAGPVLVDFWAPWCGPCRFMSPLIDEVAKEMDSKIKVGKYNVDESNTVSSSNGVMSIPTFIIWKDGVKVQEWAGSSPKEEVVERVKKVIG